MYRDQLLILIILVISQSCFSQNSLEIYNEDNYFLVGDTVIETSQKCKVYYNANLKSIKMLKCFAPNNSEIIVTLLYLKDEKFHGPCKYWTFDGVLSFTGEYFQGMKHGKWLYYQNGKLYSEKYYEKGRKVGVWKEFNKNGAVIKTYDWDNN